MADAIISGLESNTRTVQPARANTWIQLRPMTPVPTTATVLMLSFFIRWGIPLVEIGR